jgi:rhamnogalacturonyl hydrolase YesR
MVQRSHALLVVATLAQCAFAGETLFPSGPQEFAGTRYYWLADWRLEVMLPDDVAAGDRFEVLFGSKGPDKRTLRFQYEGKTGSLAEVRQKAFEWIELPLGELTAGKTVTLFGDGREKVAFLAGVRVAGKSKAAPTVKPVQVAAAAPSGDGAAVWSDLPGFEVNDETRRLWDPSPLRPDWARAERSSQYAGIALSKVQRWLRERCLPIRDERSGLFRPTGREWNYQDTAADCYPFYVWAAYYTDKEVLDTVMVDALKAEQRLCNHLDRLPVSYDMDEGRKTDLPLDRIIFGASEYAKDGLTPIVEITGKQSSWFARMRDLVDDLFKHASVETAYGKIPSSNVEVSGNLLQLLPRLYGATGDEKYLDWAHRVADHYLLPGGFVPSRLSDHGCEILGGLGLLFAVGTTARPEKAKQYQPHLEFMFDQILKRGTNSDGVIIGSLQDKEGPHDNVPTRDGWGYDFVGFLDHDLALGVQRYHEAARRPMTNLLKPRYLKFNWDHGSRDNIADSVEGGLYLLYRIPTLEAFLWADREIATLLVDHARPDRLWETHKLEANTVRTVLIHTMLHTRNTIARPWQQGLQLGAAPCGKGICVHMASDKPYEGRLQFDIPRHRLYLGFRQDWPRMNAVPEWFTVEPDEGHRYKVEEVDAAKTQVVSGKLLSEGLPVRLEPGEPLRLVVRPG